MVDQCESMQIKMAARAREMEISDHRVIAATLLPYGVVTLVVLVFVVPFWAVWLLALLCGAIGALASFLAANSYAHYCAHAIATSPLAFAQDHLPQAWQVGWLSDTMPPTVTPTTSGPTGGHDISYRLMLPVLLASGIVPVLSTTHALAIGGAYGPILLLLIPFGVTLVLTSFADAFAWSRVGRGILSRRTGIDGAEEMRREGLRWTFLAGWRAH